MYRYSTRGTCIGREAELSAANCQGKQTYAADNNNNNNNNIELVGHHVSDISSASGRSEGSGCSITPSPLSEKLNLTFCLEIFDPTPALWHLAAWVKLQSQQFKGYTSSAMRETYTPSPTDSQINIKYTLA